MQDSSKFETTHLSLQYHFDSWAIPTMPLRQHRILGPNEHNFCVRSSLPNLHPPSLRKMRKKRKRKRNSSSICAVGAKGKVAVNAGKLAKLTKHTSLKRGCWWHLIVRSERDQVSCWLGSSKADDCNRSHIELMTQDRRNRIIDYSSRSALRG